MSDKRGKDLLGDDPVAAFEEGFGEAAQRPGPINGQAPEKQTLLPPAPPETRRPGRRAQAQQAEQPAPAEPMMDDLDMILTAPTAPLMLKMLAGRIKEIESTKTAHAILSLDTRIRHLEPVVQQMSQQRAVAEIQMERQVRSAALDLAVKALAALPEADKTAETISAYADAFTQYMKVGDH
jgi:hypothetical protein